MILNMYCIYDLKALTHSVPFCTNFDATAMRHISDTMRRDSGGIYSSHPADFVLRRVGLFDDQTGEIVPEESPVDVVALSSILELEV
jgi:hypothetical protein